MKKQHLARAVAACTAPLLVVPLVSASVTGDASTTRSSTVLDNRFDTAGYRSDEVRPQQGVAEPLSGSGVFEGSDKGYLGVDLLGPNPANDPLPRTRAGDVVTATFNLPAELTLDSSPAPSGGPTRYDTNWCDPTAQLRSWAQQVTCTVDGNELSVETTLTHSLTEDEWRDFNIRVGVQAGEDLDRESAEISTTLRLPTDNASNPERRHSFIANFNLPGNALGIHTLALSTSGGSTAWWPQESGSMSFSVIPQGSTGKVDVSQGESFRVQLNAYNPSRDDAAAGKPARGGLEFRESSANADNPCSNAGNAGWMPGWMISCSHPAQGDAAPQSALEILFTRTGSTEQGHVLPRTAFRVPVGNTYASTTEDATGTDNSFAAFSADMEQQPTGPTHATSSTTLRRGNALGVAQMAVHNGRGGAAISPGDYAYAEFRLTNEPGGVKAQVRRGDVYAVDFGYERGLGYDTRRAGWRYNPCDVNQELIPGFRNECTLDPDDEWNEEEYVKVTFTRTGPDGEITIPDSPVRFPLISKVGGLSHTAVEVRAFFSSTSVQPSLGQWFLTQQVDVLPLSLGLHSADFEPASGSENPWPYQDQAWWRLRITNPDLDETFLNVHTGDSLEYKVQTMTSYVKIRSGVAGGICADQSAGAFWDGWSVSCTLEEGAKWSTLTVRLTRTGQDDKAWRIPKDFISVKIENVHVPGSGAGAGVSEVRGIFSSSSLSDDRTADPTQIRYLPMHE